MTDEHFLLCANHRTHKTLEELYMPNMIAILFTLYCFPDLVLSGQNIYWEELTLCE